MKIEQRIETASIKNEDKTSLFGKTFKVIGLGTNLADFDFGVVYAFTRLTKTGAHNPVYIGHAESMADLPKLKIWDDAGEMGVTHIHYAQEANLVKRRETSAELVMKYTPPLNIGAGLFE